MVQTLNKNVTGLINITVRLTDGSEILLRYMTHATELSPCPENLHSEWFWFVQRPIIVVTHVQIGLVFQIINPTSILKKKENFGLVRGDFDTKNRV